MSNKARISVLEARMEEREKAIRIKEIGDEKALELARAIQTYKDERANDLRSQIERERSSYATHDDLTKLTEKIDITLKPILIYVAQQGNGPRAITTQMLVGWAGTLILILAFWYSYGNKMINSVAPVPMSIVQPVK
jgi:hypothetical protein